MGNDFTHANNRPGQDMFYKFTINAPTTVKFHLCSAQQTDTYLHLLKSDNTAYYGNDNSNDCSAGSLRSNLKVENLPAGTYYIVCETNNAVDNNDKMMILWASSGSYINAGREDGDVNGDLKENVDKVTLYPNPSSGIVSLKIPGAADVLKVQIINSNGILVKQITGLEAQKELNVESLMPGIYQVIITTSEKSYVEKLELLGN
jgi:hypothetical protein